MNMKVDGGLRSCWRRCCAARKLRTDRMHDGPGALIEVAERKIGQNLIFSEQALTEARQMETFLMAMFSHVRKALRDGDKDLAANALEVESDLNRMQVGLRKSHVRRMSSNECPPRIRPADRGHSGNLACLPF